MYEKSVKYGTKVTSSGIGSSLGPKSSPKSQKIPT